MSNAVLEQEQSLHQFAIDIRNSPVDEANRTIHKVSLISLGEARGHDVFIDQKSLEQVYDVLNETGPVKVKAKHRGGTFEVIGYVDNYSRGQSKVLADLHIYESEDEAPRIFEIARKNPNHLGLSLEFGGIDEKKDGKMWARCSQIDALALVPEAAANRSLFEKVENKVDFNDKGKHNTPMSNKKFDDKPENAGDTAPKDADTDASDFQKRMEASMTRMDAFMSKYEAGLNAKSDDDKGPLPATNPNVEPKANNNGPTLTNGEKGNVKGEEPSANPTGPWEEDEKKFEARMQRVAEAATEKVVRQFGARLGIRSLPSDSTPLQSDSATDKTFEQLVSEKRTEFEKAGDKHANINATVFCMKNHKKEYSAWRPVSAKPAARIL